MSADRPATGPHAAWLSLVLDEGEPARATGTLVHLHRRPQIVTDGGQVIRSPGRPARSTMAVKLSYDGPLVDVSAHEGARVVVTGHLRNRHLAIRTAEDVTVAPVSDASLATQEDTKTFRGEGSRLSRRGPAESELMRQGALLDAWTDDKSGRRVALARDPEVVKAALAGRYGRGLDVVESRWSGEYLDEIRSAVPEHLLMSFGSDTGPDGQMRAALTLLHLPSALAHRLSRFDVDAVSLSVLISPRGN